MSNANLENHEPEYDRTFNLFYIRVNPTIKTGYVISKAEVDTSLITNLAIYDIENDEMTHFFDIGSTKKIIHYFYETEYNVKLNRMDFNRGNFRLFNNENIELRDVADKLFIITELSGGEEFELWSSTRLGKEKKLVKRFPKAINCKIDVYNKKVLFIYSLQNEIRVDAEDW